MAGERGHIEQTTLRASRDREMAGEADRVHAERFASDGGRHGLITTRRISCRG